MSKVKKTILIIIVLIALGLSGMIFSFLLTDEERGVKKMIEADSTFERTEQGYALKDAQGNVLIDNLASPGFFCNGFAKVRNNNGEHGIINSKGEMLVEFGKYKYIFQYSNWGGVHYCFYDATIENPYQSVILKYNGEILYKDDEDIFLDNVKLKTYYDNRFAVLETKDSFRLIDFTGETFETFKKSSEDSSITIDREEAKDYISVTFEDTTIIYSLKTFKPYFGPIKGTYKIEGFNTTRETEILFGIEGKEKTHEYMIVGDQEDSGSVYYLYDGKVRFEKDNCKLPLLRNRVLSCTTNSNRVYYDEYGKMVDGDNS